MRWVSFVIAAIKSSDARCDITRLLGAEPTYSRRKGDRYGPSDRYVARTGMWNLESSEPREAEIEGKIASLLRSISAPIEVWHAIAAQYRIEVRCGIFLPDENRGFEISAEVLELLAERRIKIGFDVYA